MIYFILVLVLCFIGYAFLSRRASPIPYFPSNRKDINRIVKMLHLKNDQVIYDLGAGDGIVIFSAARVAQQKKLNTRFVAVEINPVLLAVLWLRRLFHSNRSRIDIIYEDIFTMNFEDGAKHQTFFAYISPWYLERVIENCKRQMRSFSFISYFYPLTNHEANARIAGVHTVYQYLFS